MLSSLSASITNARQSIAQVLNFALVLSTAFMMWKGSMEPAFQRGDLLFLWNRSPVELGEVVVYNVRGKDIPIVHRVVRTFPEVEGRGSAKKVKEVTVYDPAITITWAFCFCWFVVLMRIGSRDASSSRMLLTKGDNNLADDTELYAEGQDHLNRAEDIVGSVRGYIPMVGYVTIMLSEHPWLKTVMLGIMGLMVMLQRE
ncbi:Signal peptidase I [Penicillium sp. DV-2018c]|nr:Signal peptidase I [Penicillium sp. DV-2018c]